MRGGPPVVPNTVSALGCPLDLFEVRSDVAASLAREKCSIFLLISMSFLPTVPSSGFDANTLTCFGFSQPFSYKADDGLKIGPCDLSAAFSADDSFVIHSEVAVLVVVQGGV